MYVLRNGTSSSTMDGSVFLCRRYFWCTIVSALMAFRSVCTLYTLCHCAILIFIQNIQSFSTTAGLYCSLCLNLFNYSETAVSWTVVGLTAAQFSSNGLMHVSPCPIPHTFGFTLFRIAPACDPHNLIIHEFWEPRAIRGLLCIFQYIQYLRILRSAGAAVSRSEWPPHTSRWDRLSHNWPNQNFIRKVTSGELLTKQAMRGKAALLA
jgi:hypothetical protein